MNLEKSINSFYNTFKSISKYVNAEDYDKKLFCFFLLLLELKKELNLSENQYIQRNTWLYVSFGSPREKHSICLNDSWLSA